MKYRNFLLLLFAGCLSISASCNAQSEKVDKDGIQWMSFEQAVAKSAARPKKLFIDISTDWCGWCKRMDATTFKDTAVIRFLNDNYYAVRLNAETRDTIHFQDKQFIYKTEYKANELALALLNGKMSYPSFVFMDEKIALLSPLPGYQTVPQIMPVLHYFADNSYLKTKWEDYQKTLGN